MINICIITKTCDSFQDFVLACEDSEKCFLGTGHVIPE